MNLQERYQGLEGPENGTRAPSDGPLPVEPPDGGDIAYEADRLTVALVLAKRQHGVKVGEVTFVDANQRPFVLFADANDPVSPWGSSIEAFIDSALRQAYAKEEQAE